MKSFIETYKQTLLTDAESVYDSIKEDDDPPFSEEIVLGYEGEVSDFIYLSGALNALNYILEQNTA